MSERDFEVVRPPEPTSGGISLDSFDPLRTVQQPQRPGYKAHGVNRSWSWLMYTMGRRAPQNLAKAANYRRAMLKLRMGARRIR